MKQRACWKKISPASSVLTLEQLEDERWRGDIVGVVYTKKECEELDRFWWSVRHVLIRDRENQITQVEMAALAAKFKAQGVTAEESVAAVEAVYKLKEESAALLEDEG